MSVKRDQEREKKLAIERWEHRVSRKGKQYSRSLEISQGGTHQGVKFRSRILDLYHPFIPFKNRQRLHEGYFVVPKNFSLSENTADVLAFFHELVEFARCADTPKILLDYREVDSVGLSADAILSVLIQEITREFKQRRGSYVRGWRAKKKSVAKLMAQIGSVRTIGEVKRDNMAQMSKGRPFRRREVQQLGVELSANENVYKYQNSFSIRQSGTIPDVASATSRAFADHLNTCLKHVGKRLTNKARDDLLQYVGEVLTNAHDHSGHADWLIVGYIDQDDAELVYRCAIISFGRTIAQTFRELPRDSFANREVNEYVALHEKGRLFSADWQEGDLIAVMSLQESVSSLNVDEDSTRGQGTVDFIEFFQKVTEACTGRSADQRMTVLSGSTKISFDGSYHMQESKPSGRKVIAFNEANDLSKRPDPSAVKSIANGHFPGVSISIAAPLASVMVENTDEHEDEN